MTRQGIICAQHRVQALLDEAVADGSESALQVAAYLHGDLIVDSWAAPEERAVDGETLFPFFSTGKGIAATAVHRLVEKGTLSWDDPIARHWPEFAAHGKDGTLVRHALHHTAGLPVMPLAGDFSLAGDWDAMCEFVAASVPLHPPGARRHYHAITYSWLLGETARRADGRDFARIINEEVCQPLGIDSLFFGVPESDLPRCVDAEKALPVPDAPAQPPAEPDPVAARAIPAWVCPLEDWINSDTTRRACIPASNGFGTARALARHYAALVGDGVAGVRLLANQTIAAATRWDPLVEASVSGDGRWGLGYALSGPDECPGTVFGHGGYGGSTACADTRYGLAIAVVKSRMGGDITGRVAGAIRGCIGAE